MHVGRFHDAKRAQGQPPLFSRQQSPNAAPMSPPPPACQHSWPEACRLESHAASTDEAHGRPQLSVEFHQPTQKRSKGPRAEAITASRGTPPGEAPHHTHHRAAPPPPDRRRAPARSRAHGRPRRRQHCPGFARQRPLAAARERCWRRGPVAGGTRVLRSRHYERCTGLVLSAKLHV